MKLGLEGKKAVITGGATGIGKAIVQALVNEGVKVVFTSRKQGSIDALAKGIDPRLLHGVLLDVSEDGGPKKLHDAAINFFGHPEIVVNNVGDTLGITDPLCSTEDWRKVYRLNLEVHIENNNLFLPEMQKQKYGRIVNISAGASMENSGPVPYCSIKAAYTAYSRSMARVLAS